MPPPSFTAPIKLATPQFELGLNSPRPTLGSPGYVVVERGLAGTSGAALYRDVVSRTRLFGGGMAARLMDGIERLTPRSIRKGSPGSGAAEVSPSDLPQAPSNLYMTSSMFRNNWAVPGSPDEVAQDKAKKLTVAKPKAQSLPTSPSKVFQSPPAAPPAAVSGKTSGKTASPPGGKTQHELDLEAKMRENAKRLEHLSSNDAINEFEATLAARANAKRKAERKAEKSPNPPLALPAPVEAGAADGGNPNPNPNPKLLKEKLLAEGWTQDPNFPDQWIPPGASKTS